jgi:hypothetical protein
MVRPPARSVRLAGERSPTPRLSGFQAHVRSLPTASWAKGDEVDTEQKRQTNEKADKDTCQQDSWVYPSLPPPRSQETRQASPALTRSLGLPQLLRRVLRLPGFGLGRLDLGSQRHAGVAVV